MKFEFYQIFLIITLVLHFINILLSAYSIKKLNNAGLFVIIIVSILFVFILQFTDFIYYYNNPLPFINVTPFEFISFFGSLVLALIITSLLLTSKIELKENREKIRFHPINERYFYRPPSSTAEQEIRIKTPEKKTITKVTTNERIEEKEVEKPSEVKLKEEVREEVKTEIKFQETEHREEKPFVAKYIKQEPKTEAEKIKNELERITFQRDKLVSIISHDLRTPLNSVFGYCQLLKDGHYKSKQEVKKFADSIFELSKQQLTALNRIVEWTRYESSKLTMNPTEFDVTSTINFVAKTMTKVAENKRIKINVISKPELIVFGDEFMIIDVLKNLLENAIKFSYPESTIEIHTHYHEKLNKLIVLVVDSGIGIDKEVLMNLLVSTKKFTTRGTMGEKGLGLGLLIVKAIIDKHGESLWIASEKGKWTRVYFTLSPAKRA